MKKEELELLIKEIESNASNIKRDFEIADSFSKILDNHKERLTPEQEQELKWEYLLFRLTTKNKFANDGVSTERFVPMMRYVDGTIFPNPNSLSPALEYFETRAKECNNPILKARYLDFLWVKSKSKSKHLFAIEAISQYLSNVDSYKNEDAIIERLDGLQRATELALIIEKKTDKRPLTERVVSKLNEQIEATSKSGKHRWLIEMFEVVIVLLDFYSKEEISKLVLLCDLAIESYHSEKNFHLQRHFLYIKGVKYPFFCTVCLNGLG